ncbi:exodeoxyribonuclease V subunit alpha [Neisseria sp.]|uniref:exodeoxyribonuclease V subunit alpha n=1 Tax=Neisseria sp. TaxID=192066 RepID=UPI00359F1819
MTVQTTLPAADAAAEFFRRHAPDAAPAVAPLVRRLFAALEEGHSFIETDRSEAAQLAELPELAGAHGGTPLVLRGRKLFLGRMWRLERDLAAEIVRLARAECVPPDWFQTAFYLENWFSGAGSEGQRDAAALALLQNFMLISGGPGTGKTTTVAKLLALVCSNGTAMPRIALAASTGKAASHMAHALHRALDGFDMPESVRAGLSRLEGQTVHRLLKLRPPQMQGAFDRANPLPLDVLVVDEASMLDTALMLQLLRAVPTGCRVVLLGDENQLPSVGAGAVLAALSQPTVLDVQTASSLQQMVPRHGFAVSDNPPPLARNVAHLTVSHRFGPDSGIGCLARAAAAGDGGTAWAQFAAFPDELAVAQGGVKQQAAAFYAKQADYWQAVDAGDIALAFGRQADAVVLAAWRDDAAAFNEAYRRLLQQHGRIKGDAAWFAGQVVMMTRNDYALELFNGDIGIVLHDRFSDGLESGQNHDGHARHALAAFFPAADGFRKIPLSRLGGHETAFAMTVHKSQGSEYREVWLLPPSVPTADADGAQGLNRALFYTAVTRARERFVFWGTQAELETAVRNDRPRRSALKEMLAEADAAWDAPPRYKSG